MKPTAARILRPKRYDKEYDTIIKRWQKLCFCLDDRQSRLLPGRHTTEQGFGVFIPLRVILICPTGRGVLVVSGTIEDDFLVFGELADSSREFVQRNAAFQLHAPTGLVAVIGTHQEAGAGFHPGINFFRGNTRNFCHG
jgi:hypothetical protein